MAALDPQALFEQAELLIAPRRPGPARQVDLRRAVSAAYYGVFHFICAQAANLFVGRGRQREPRYSLVYRSVDHRELRTVCKAVQAARLDFAVAQLAPASGFAAGLKQFAGSVSELQSLRHMADYDPNGVFSTKDAHFAIQAGRGAVAAFGQASAEERAAFLTLLLFKRR